MPNNYIRTRLAQIASGDYKACGHTAEQVAADALQHLNAIEPMGDDVTLPEESAEYWKEAIGGTYKPVKLNKHTASHPTTIKRVLASVEGSEAADVIASLVQRTCIIAEREKFAWEEVSRLKTDLRSRGIIPGEK